MNQTGNCPRCGAPIWSSPNMASPGAAPVTVFTCDCHKWLQLAPVLSFPLYQPPKLPDYVPAPLIPDITWSSVFPVMDPATDKPSK